MITMSIELPFFCGFYETPFLNSDMEYYAIQEDLEYLNEQYGEELTEDDYEIDFVAYKQEVIDNFIEVFKNLAPDFITNIELEEMVSPKEYNYSTDRLFANVTLEDDYRAKMLEFMETNREWLSKRISIDWTSYDGFISFMPNTYAEWYDEISSETPDERFITAMITYMMYHENSDIKEEIIYGTMENVYIGSFIKKVA